MSNEEKEVAGLLGQGNYIRYSVSLATELGPLSALILSAMIDWNQYMNRRNLTEEDHSFYMEQSFIEKRTAISVKSQRTEMGFLAERGILSWERKGLGARNYYKINYVEIKKLILKNDEAIIEEGLVQTDPGYAAGEYLDTPQGHLYNNIKPKSIKPEKDKGSFPAEKNPLSIMVSETETNIPVLKKRIIPLFEKTTRHHYRKDVLEIISYWNNSPGLTKHRIPTGESSPTKTFLTIVRSIGKVLDGSFFISAGMPDKNRVYTKEEIILAIDRFKLVSTNISYLPANKSWFSGFGLSVFFFNPYSKSVPSQFLQCLENEPKLIVSSVPIQPDNNPQLTKWLKEAYINKVLLGQTRKFSPIEENKFIVGANQLHSTIRVLQLKLNMMTRPIEWCYLVIESLVDQWKDKEIVPGHIASEYTYVETLPRYLKKKGRIG